MSGSLGDRISTIRKTLPSTVKLVAVSKYADIESIRAAYAAGIRDFGESKVQDAKQKQQQLSDLTDISWHFIGHLQTNKSKIALQHFSWIHSVDRLNLAQQLDRLIAEMGITSPCICLQVKLADDPQKSGWYEQELLADLDLLKQCQNLNIVGLMTILPLGLSEAQAIEVFNKTEKLATKLRSQGWENLHHLSMGMSDDYQLAVKSGSTIVRIGSMIFAKS